MRKPGFGPRELYPSNKRVRVFFGAETVADSRCTQLLRGDGQIAIYYFPREDVNTDLPEPAGEDASIAAFPLPL